MTKPALKSVPPAPQPANDERLLKDTEVAKLLSVTVSAMRMWRVRGTGPKFVMLGERCPRYRRCDVDAFIESRLRTRNGEGESE